MMASATGVVIDADSNDDPGLIVQQLGEDRGKGLVAVKSFSKRQTLFREKVRGVKKICKLEMTFSGVKTQSIFVATCLITIFLECIFWL